MNKPMVRRLSSGYWHIRWSRECWAQVPCGDTLRREHVFHPAWNWRRVSTWATSPAGRKALEE